MCIRVSVRNSSFRKVFGTWNLQEQLSYQAPLKMNSVFLLTTIPPPAHCLHIYSNVDIYSLQSISCWIPKWKQLRTECSTSVIGKSWALELKATRPGYFSQWRDTRPHSCLFIFSSLFNFLSRIYLLNPSVPNHPKTWYWFLHYCWFSQLVVFVETLTCIQTQENKPLLQIENLHTSQLLNNYSVLYTFLSFNTIQLTSHFIA